jgi:hypothetical protein
VRARSYARSRSPAPRPRPPGRRAPRLGDARAHLGELVADADASAGAAKAPARDQREQEAKRAHQLLEELHGLVEVGVDLVDRRLDLVRAFRP